MTARKKRQRRRLIILAAGIVLPAIAILVGAAISSGVFSTARSADSCVIADLSHSTVAARPRYVGAFRDFAQRAGNEHSGDLCLILAGRDPLAESPPLWTSVAPQSDRDALKAPVEIRTRVESAVTDFESYLDNPPIEGNESALVEAAVAAGRVLEEGDELLLLSDGYQNSPATGRIKKLDLTTAKIELILDRLEASGLLADLRGVEISYPLMLFHPGGTEVGASAIRVRQFWDAWIARTGADLISGVEEADRGFESGA